MRLSYSSALFLLLTTVALHAAPAPATDDGNVVVMISVDGLANFYIDDPKCDTPTLHMLAEQGARAEGGMQAVAPSVTWPNHTTLVTGMQPAKHGVVGNNYLDRATGKHVVLISDPVFDKDQIVKVPTIYDLAKSAGMATAAIRWPASRNAKSLDWTTPDVLKPDLIKQFSTPALVEECKQAGCWYADDLNFDDMAQVDRNVTAIFKLILQKHHPRLALLHLTDVDHTQHNKGPRSADAYRVVHTADAQIKEIWDEMQQDFPGKCTLFVVSDHGFSPIRKMILPNVILRKAGLIETKLDRVVSKDVQIVVQGGCAMVYILDASHRDEIETKIEAAMKDVEGVEKIVDTAHLKDLGVADPKDDPHAPDMLLFADLGYVFGDTAAGDMAFRDKPERLGSHGHDPNIPDLHATFIAAGYGVDKGLKLGEITNRDVAPTIAKLLKLDLTNADGKALAIFSN